MLPTAERVRILLNYSPETGLFYWKGAGPGKHLDRPAGTIGGEYLKIGIDGKQHCSHFLAWLFVHGVWPQKQIDHINREKKDNRIENLRLATPSQNHANKPAYSHSRTSVRGVHRHPSGRFRVQFQKDGKTHSFGYFPNLYEASEAAIEAAHSLHGEFAGNRL